MGTNVLYDRGGRGTNVHIQVAKCIKYNKDANMLYMSEQGKITKRRIRIVCMKGDYFKAYCYLRKSNRLFKTNNILALLPIMNKERGVV